MSILEIWPVPQAYPSGLVVTSLRAFLLGLPTGSQNVGMFALAQLYVPNLGVTVEIPEPSSPNSFAKILIGISYQ